MEFEVFLFLVALYSRYKLWTTRLSAENIASDLQTAEECRKSEAYKCDARRRKRGTRSEVQWKVKQPSHTECFLLLLHKRRADWFLYPVAGISLINRIETVSFVTYLSYLHLENTHPATIRLFTI